MVKGFLDNLKLDVRNYCRRRRWHIHLIFMAFFVYFFLHYIKDPDDGTFFSAINFAFYEAGYFLFRPFGEFFCVLGGVFLQLAMPAVFIYILYRQIDFFGILFCGTWLATNLFGIAKYMADASAGSLPPVTVGPVTGDLSHDWNFIFTRWGVLEYDILISNIIRGLGFAVLVVAIILGSYLLFKMYKIVK